MVRKWSFAGKICEVNALVDFEFARTVKADD